MSLLLVLAVVAVVVGICIWTRPRRPKNFPPGPPVMPITGNIHTMPPKPHLAILGWKKKYGDIFSFFMGHQVVVVLNNIHTVRKVFNEENVTGRHKRSTIRLPGSVLPLGLGLLFSEGSLWKVHRRFALSTLRDLGMGKNWLEDIIISEVAAICQVLRETNHKPFNPRVQLTNSVSNIICALIFGQRFALNDPKFTMLTNLIAQNIAILKYDVVVQGLPFFMWFPNYVRNKVYTARSNVVKMCAFLRETIQEHEQVRRKEAQTPDYLHAYQNEKENGAKMSDRETFTEQQLVCSLFDLFSAGTDTTATTMLWAFVFMVENPDVMQKVQTEIDSNTGRDEVLTYSHRGRLPYTGAVILEIQRFASLVPLGAPHTNHEEMEIDGYIIPKNTVITANFYSIHRDPRWWKNPDKFDPGHFLDENSKPIRPEAFAPFSLGKRACPGEALAKMELFLFFANILRCFTLKAPPGSTVSHTNYKAGFTLSPNPFELIFVPRA